MKTKILDLIGEGSYIEGAVKTLCKLHNASVNGITMSKILDLFNNGKSFFICVYNGLISVREHNTNNNNARQISLCQKYGKVFICSKKRGITDVTQENVAKIYDALCYKERITNDKIRVPKREKTAFDEGMTERPGKRKPTGNSRVYIHIHKSQQALGGEVFL